jgi:hypothetical protein
MILDEVNLMELEDYINWLDETVGLKIETVLDVQNAISKRRNELKNFHKSDVIKSVCVGCGNPVKDFDENNNNCCDECWLSAL